MPLLNLEALLTNERLLGAASRLPTLEPGMVLATGQTLSGKLTTLLALVQTMLESNPAVVLLSDHAGHFDSFRPFPETWREVIVNPTPEEWEKAIQRESDTGAIIVVAPLNRINAGPTFKAAIDHWVFGELDTALVGIDVAYALYEMGVGYESFVDSVRAIWSQFLVKSLCMQCAKPASLSPKDREYLFPGDVAGTDLYAEGGCTACDWTGTTDREAIADVTMFDSSARRVLSATLLHGEKQQVAQESHVTIQEQARDLLETGRLGVGTYRDMIRRNPLLRALNEVEREQARSFKLGKLFDKFVSREVKQRLLDGEQKESLIRGEARNVTCLFCDIRGFTTRSELCDPQVLFADLNLYFADIVDAVLTHEGTLDKFIGDAVMAVFGAPTEQPDHARRAVECALTIRRRVEALNNSSFKDMPIYVGIGINSGRAATGCVGTDERMEYTALGDAINIAARLESKAAPGEILISDATRQSICGKFQLASAGCLTLKGKSEQVEAFNVIGRV